MRAVALVLACVLLGCAKSKPLPPEGSGIVPPTVPADTPADYAVRWPVPAKADVTLFVRMENRSAMAVRGRVELEPPSHDGTRVLRQSEFEAAGGDGDQLVSLGVNWALGKSATVIAADGSSGDDGNPLWGFWVEVWKEYKDLAEGTESVLSGAAAEVPDGIEIGLQKVGASRLPGAVRLRFRMTAVSEAGRKFLEGQFGVRTRAPVRELEVLGDVDPRTLQPLLVDLIVRFADTTDPFHMTFEWNWSPPPE